MHICAIVHTCFLQLLCMHVNRPSHRGASVSVIVLYKLKGFHIINIHCRAQINLVICCRQVAHGIAAHFSSSLSGQKTHDAA